MNIKVVKERIQRHIRRPLEEDLLVCARVPNEGYCEHPKMDNVDVLSAFGKQGRDKDGPEWNKARPANERRLLVARVNQILIL